MGDFSNSVSSKNDSVSSNNNNNNSSSSANKIASTPPLPFVDGSNDSFSNNNSSSSSNIDASSFSDQGSKKEPSSDGDRTNIGLSYTIFKDRVIKRTTSFVFHKDGEQPKIEDGKVQEKDNGSPSIWRRYSDSALCKGGGEMVVKSFGWPMVDPDDWALEEMPRQTKEEVAAMPWRSYYSSEGSASSYSAEDSASKKSPSQRLTKKDEEFFESLLVKGGMSRGKVPAKGHRLEAKSSLAHPLVFNPEDPQDSFPYEVFTDTTPECAALGHYHSRPKPPTHPLMTSPNFTILIRMEGPFDRSGRQPGLMIRTTHFTIRVLEKGFVPGERTVEIWRNGETLQLNGLIAVLADEREWFLGDKALRKIDVGRNLALGVGLGQP
ncbi:hypothetical protein P171DRAFT_525834 [Karstenula rhodostoma CBS 690.94]|uniref:Uncharacterized protein n=1 Tax=Karstenula rhodostoma CBS 690.94 TaxID=1392251 RepID=A0A9P4U564_9PLEO|nr:hypothetical protein P171DRAFT_525834 [Karstenula rhodostoma CBS 690.94]